MENLFLIVKVLHVLFASMWVGGALLNLIVLQPLVANATAPTGREMSGRIFPAFARYFNIVGGLAILTGVALVSLHPNGWANFTGTAWGKLVAFALIGSLLALYLLNVALRPTFKALSKMREQMAPGDAPPAAFSFLQARMRFTGYLIAGLLLLVLFVMVTANLVYFGPA